MTFERGVAIGAAVIVVAGVIVYSNSLAAPFIFDDRTAILDNQQIRQLWPLSVPLSPQGRFSGTASITPRSRS